MSGPKVSDFIENEEPGFRTPFFGVFGPPERAD